jgi:preprotein translocase subunit SecY
MRARLTRDCSASTMDGAVRIAVRRTLITLGLLFVYRLGFMVPIPGLSVEFLSSNRDQGSIFGLMSAFSGGAIGQTTIYALGLLPYIVSSLALAVLARTRSQRAMSRRELEAWKRWMVAPIAVVLGLAVHFGVFVRHPEMIEASLRGSPGLVCVLVVLSLTAASVFVMRLAELISERGVGHGTFVIVTAGILARIPHAFLALPPEEFWPAMLYMIGIWLATTLAVVFIFYGTPRTPSST